MQELLLDRVELLLGVGAVGEARRTAERAVDGLEAAALGLHLPEAMLLLAQATVADGRPVEAGPVAAEAARLFTVRVGPPGRCSPVTSGCSPTSGPDGTRRAAARVAGGGGVPEQQPVAGA